MTPTVDDLETIARTRHLCTTGQARRLRKTAHLSLRELAAAIDTTATTLYRWETGISLPPGEEALRYATALDRLATNA